MDDRRFDAAARALGAGASRRRVLGGLVAGAFGLLAGGRARAQGEDASACAALLCVTNTKCCSVCGQGSCVPIGEPCPTDACPGEACGGAVCGAGEFCCNESCSICAPLDGACTQQICVDEPGEPAEMGEPCNQVTCGRGEFCCNESCSTCAPIGGVCTQQICAGEAPGAPEFERGQLVATTAGLEVRTAPTLVAEVVAEFPAGASLTILAGPFSFVDAVWYLIALPASVAADAPSVGFVDAAGLVPA